MGSRKSGIAVQDEREVASPLSSLVPPISVLPASGSEDRSMPSSHVPDFGAHERALGFGLQNPCNMSRDIFNLKFSGQSAVSNALGYDAMGKAIPSPDPTTPDSRSRSLSASQQKGVQSFPSLPGNQFENWGDSPVAAEKSPRTDTSTDVDTDERSQGKNAMVAVSDSSDRSKDKAGDQKTLRRLAQNREAARKSRLRKKAYVQQLESSRLKLNQIEQELQRARQQGMFISSSGDQSHSTNANGALTFDMEYARWLEEHNRQISELRAAVNAHASDNDLRSILDAVMAHYDEIFRLKSVAAKADVFHILSGMWQTPAERCFMWLGGFRSSELLKLLVRHLEPLTEQQMAGICNLQQSSLQAEDALSQGMDALQQSLAETLASGSLGAAGSSGNVANYMGQMAMAMGKLGTLENFLRQADNLRQQTLQQMHRTLTIRQSARAHLAINDYFSRLRALSSLWLARPRE
ncbi:transcription factor TGA2.3-like [Wolffia australiana]